jgi:peptide/nickel transport system permease protein
MVESETMSEKRKKILNLFRRLFTNSKFTAGFGIFMSLVLISIIGRVIVTYNPQRSMFPIAQPPSPEHILGTCGMGRDVFAQICVAIQNSLIIGFFVALITTPIGLALGFISGYYGGILDIALRFIMDIFLLLPMLPILILISTLARITDIFFMALILSIFYWAWFARSVRSETLSLKERDFIRVSKLSGMSGIEIVFTDIFPHMFQWVGARFINTVLSAIMTEVGLGLLGIGPANLITLGMMFYWITGSGAIFRGLWWWWAPPVIVLILLFTSLYYMHLGIDEIINPRLGGEA